MFEKNVVEIVLRPQAITLEEFDKSIPISEVISSLEETGHNAKFLAEIKDGLENSSIHRS